jgi:protein SCO1/2
MKSAARTKLLIIMTFFIIGLITFAIVNWNAKRNSELPIFNPTDFNPELVDATIQGINKNHTVSDFDLINQNGKVITQADYNNKIYVTDFFFTSCPSICPIMSNNMEKLQNIFLKENEVMFLSMSVTPEMDSVPVLKKYAEKNGVLDTKWNITTGDKKHIYNLARKSYFAAVDQGDGGLQDFIHTPNFILIDQEKRIRGVYDGTKEEEMDRIAQDIKRLLKI